MEQVEGTEEGAEEEVEKEQVGDETHPLQCKKILSRALS